MPDRNRPPQGEQRVVFSVQPIVGGQPTGESATKITRPLGVMLSITRITRKAELALSGVKLTGNALIWPILRKFPTLKALSFE